MRPSSAGSRLQETFRRPASPQRIDELLQESSGRRNHTKSQQCEKADVVSVLVRSTVMSPLSVSACGLVFLFAAAVGAAAVVSCSASYSGDKGYLYALLKEH